MVTGRVGVNGALAQYHAAGDPKHDLVHVKIRRPSTEARTVLQTGRWHYKVAIAGKLLVQTVYIDCNREYSCYINIINI